MLENISGIIAVQLRRIFLHGVLYIQHEGILFIPDFDQAQGLCRRHGVLRHHCRDVIAVKADRVRQDQPIFDIPELGIRHPGMPGCRIIMLFLQVEAGQNVDNAINLFRLRRVYGEDPSVGNGRMQNARDISPAVT